MYWLLLTLYSIAFKDFPAMLTSPFVSLVWSHSPQVGMETAFIIHSILMSAHESGVEFFRPGVAMYGLAHYDHIVDEVRTISYFLLCLLSLLVYNFNILVLCLK